MSSDPLARAEAASSTPEAGQLPQQGSSGTPSAVWDVEAQTWVYTDPASGNQFEWNAAAQTYVPRVRSAYCETSNPSL